MSRQEIENAHKLQENLLKKHEGKVLTDVFQGEVCQTSQGSCYKIEESENLKFSAIQKKKAIISVLNDLKLIEGIGNSREQYLKNEGYETIGDLVEHPKFSDKASEFLNIFEESPLDCMVRYYSGSHPNLLFTSSFTDLEDLIFFDIETMGLKDLPVILIGMARIKGNQIDVIQYLATDLEDERSMLECFLSNLNNKTIFVSFNGRSFDLPYIRGRNRFHGIGQDLDYHHLDLLHFSRRTWGRTLPNCRLQTLEKHLFCMHRSDDVPSSQVPVFYSKYLQTKNIGPLIPIVEHNKQDVITLAKILSRLQEEIP